MQGRVTFNVTRFLNARGFPLNGDTHYPGQGTAYGYVEHIFIGNAQEPRTDEEVVETFRHESAHAAGFMDETETLTVTAACA